MNWELEVDKLYQEIINGDVEKQRASFYVIDGGVTEQDSFPDPLLNMIIISLNKLKLKESDESLFLLKIFENNLFLMNEQQKMIVGDFMEKEIIHSNKDSATIILSLELLVDCYTAVDVLRKFSEISKVKDFLFLPYGIKYLLNQDVNNDIKNECISILEKLTKHFNKDIALQAERELKKISVP